jgi:polysaccharide export outer membrane protein
MLQLVLFALSSKAAAPPILPGPDSSLPLEIIGADDLLTVTVRDCPELSKSFRVSNDGTLTLPLLDRPVQAAGTTANTLSELIANELSRADVLVAPIVSIEVAEYRSRFVTVAGAVKHPGRIQLTGHTTVLDALAASEGTLPEAGPRLFLKTTSQSGSTQMQSIYLKQLLEKSDATSNPVLTGGEEIRVPEAEKVYVAGNVKHPGAYAVHDGESSSILKALAECEGTLPFSSKTAYIYRATQAGQPRTEIPIALGKLLARKSADVPLLGTDILYVPDHRGKRMTAQVLDRIIQFSAYSSSQALVFGR